MKKAICFLAAALFPLAASAGGRELTPREIAPYFASRPVVASNGTGFLAAWVPSYPANRIDVMPFDSNGQAKATSALPLPIFHPVQTVDIAATGDGYVAAVLDYLGTLRLMFLDSEGRLIRTASTVVREIREPRLAVNGHNMVIVGRSYKGLSAFFIDDQASIASSTVVYPNEYTPFSVASTENGFVIAIGGVGSSIQRFTATGDRMGSPIRLDFPLITLDVATHDGTIAVGGSDGSSQLLGFLVGSDGAIQQKRLLLRRDTHMTEAHIAFASGSFRIAFSESSELTGSALHRLSVVSMFDGSATPVHHIEDGVDALTPTAIAANGDVLVAVGEVAYSAVSIAWRATDPLTARRDTISVHPIDQYLPSLATDGRDFLAVWSDGQVRTARVAANGTLLDPEPLVIANDRFRPLVAFGNGAYLIVFQQGNDMRAVRMAPDGTIIDSTPIAIRENKGAASAVTWSGRNFLIIGVDISGIFAIAVTPEGIVTPAYDVSPALTADSGPKYYGQAVIASTDDGRSVVAYSSITLSPASDSPPADVHLELVPIDSFGRPSSTPIRIAPGSSFPSNFAIAHGIGDELLLVTADGAGLSSTPIRNGAELSLSPSARIFSWSSGGLNPAVAWDGSQYIVSWTYEASSPPTWMLPPSTPLHAYVGLATVNSRGTIDDLRYSRAPAVDVSLYGRPIALAINGRKDALLLTSEPVASGSDRLMLYTRGDFAEAPPRPAPPTITRYSVFTDLSAILQWTQDGTVIDGYVVDALWPEWTERLPDVIPGADRRASIDRVLTKVSMRAFNAGGFSDPSSAAAPEFSRRRPVHSP